MSRRRFALNACVLLALSSTAGCYHAQMRSGLPPGDAAAGYDFRWKNAFLFGAADPEAELDLHMLCPTGWAEIDEQNDLLTTTTTIGTLGIYTPRRVTIVCAAETKSQRPAQDGYDVPMVADPVYPARDMGYPPPPPSPRAP